MTVHARVLGIAQDAGVPQINCACPRCARFAAAPLLPACLGVVAGDRAWLVDATPAIGAQIRMLGRMPEGILLTHVHMRHVAGLRQLGEEALDARDVEVFGTPHVCSWIEKNEPWRRLVKRKNIRLVYENAGTTLDLADGLAVESFPVHHRDLETVGYRVRGPGRSLVWLPDIDRWDLDLDALIDGCDLALLDGTFYTRGEIARQGNVPHPPIEETLDRLDPGRAAKVRFVHLNHTNRLLDADGPAALVAVQGETIPLG